MRKRVILVLLFIKVKSKVLYNKANNIVKQKSLLENDSKVQ